jgi:PAS domain-containing protein
MRTRQHLEQLIIDGQNDSTGSNVGREDPFRLLIENSHDIIYSLTSSGVFTYVSPVWTELLGHPVSEVVGKSFQVFVHPDEVTACFVWL